MNEDLLQRRLLRYGVVRDAPQIRVRLQLREGKAQRGQLEDCISPLKTENFFQFTQLERFLHLLVNVDPMGIILSQDVWVIHWEMLRSSQRRRH